MSVKVSQFPELEAVIGQNKSWAKKTCDDEPEFFNTLAKGQKPGILWIGCADSRVPESVVMGCKPGEVFVHRNIANQYQPDDDSANSLLDYGVMTVGVKHVIITGHTGCGGCIAAYNAPDPSKVAPPHNALTRFLDPIVHLKHSMPKGSTVDDLIKENVRVGIENLAKSEIIQTAWKRAKAGQMKDVYIHGWVFNLATGHIEDLGISQGPESLNKANGTNGTNGSA